MRRESALAVAALALLALTVATALFVPGVLADRSEDRPPGRIGLHDDVAVSPETITGETATLALDIRLDHRGGPADNVTVEVRGVDAQTGLLVTTTTVPVGTVTGEREVPVRANLTVPRDGDYEFEVFVYQDGRRVATGTTTVGGVGSLTPDYAQTSVQFERFEDSGIPTVTYTIANATGERVELATRTHLTNVGDEQVDGLTLVVFARQAESNIIADRQSVDVGAIRPGRTSAASARLSVPDDHNYRLDALVQRDGVILGVESATAELAPTEPLPENTSQERVEIRASEFQREDGDTTGDAGAVTTRTPGSEGPGFTAGLALVAILVAALFPWRDR